MTNANFWLRASANAATAQCVTTEEDGALFFRCQKPICLIEYRFTLTGRTPLQNVDWMLEHGTAVADGSVQWLRLASGGPTLPDFVPGSGSVIPTYQIQQCLAATVFSTNLMTTPAPLPSCGTEAASDVWLTMKPGDHAQALLNTFALLSFTSFPFYPVTMEEAAIAISAAYGVNLARLQLDNASSTGPLAYDMSATYTIASQIDSPKIPYAMTSVEQASMQNATEMSNAYVVQESQRIEVMSNAFVNNPGAFAAYFKQAVPSQSWLPEKPLASLRITSTQLGAKENQPAPVRSALQSSVPIAVPSLLAGYNPVAQVVTSCKFETPSVADTEKLVSKEGQPLLQAALAGYVRLWPAQVSIDSIFVTPPAPAPQAISSRRLPVQAGEFSVVFAIQALNPVEVTRLEEVFTNGAKSLHGVDGDPAYLVGNLSYLVTEMKMAATVKSAQPVLRSTYARMVIPAMLEKPVDPSTTAEPESTSADASVPWWAELLAAVAAIAALVGIVLCICRLCKRKKRSRGLRDSGQREPPPRDFSTSEMEPLQSERTSPNAEPQELSREQMEPVPPGPISHGPPRQSFPKTTQLATAQQQYMPVQQQAPQYMPAQQGSFAQTKQQVPQIYQQPPGGYTAGSMLPTQAALGQPVRTLSQGLSYPVPTTAAMQPPQAFYR
jgi:hypothetical protein